MTRQIVLDTETTGLSAEGGDRIIEIGCVELISRKSTGRNFHRYLNPERKVEAGALAVHGLDDEFLADKPRFVEIVDELLTFIDDAELIIHNAAFDTGFLDMELGRLGRGTVRDYCAGVIDTLMLARELHPGRKNSLNALCERYQVDHSGRTLHGALLDASLLAEVYLAMTRGQESLMIAIDPAPRLAVAQPNPARSARVLHADAEELAAHHRILDEIERESRGRCLWLAAAAAAESTEASLA